MKDRMRELNIKMTELADYLKVSRPTLYKYIESYESGNQSGIPDRVADLFRLMDDPSSTKEQVVSFAIAAFSGSEGTDSKETIRRYLVDPNASQSKIELMYRLSTSNCIDDLIPYLNGCMDVLSQDKKDDDSLYQIARLILMRSKVTRNIPLKEEELQEAREIMRR